MSHGTRILFTDVNLHIKNNKRYGLVGANGAGQTTFFKVLTKEKKSQLSVRLTYQKTPK
ncbi:MAG TPA: ATP-binding cassette domain-containing protein [Rickettsia endosymbiont of Proechinophthirus fluctus]|nr:ATP-binding cassette domain-containing protein [Rickettsia endosymbiont of Proechinophthirus fluctus]HJD54371.1 ATP-binding cassette domain-containing protein [Rickettsia endosymbiont of Proechinophthirus fluctus]